MSYCSRSRRRRFTIVYFKSSKVVHIVAFTAIFSNILLCMRRNGYLWTFSVNLTRFPIRVQNFGDFVTFSVDFCILYSECFYFRFVWPTDLERVDPHVDNSHQVWCDMTICYRVTAFLSADTSRNLVTLTFDLLTLNRSHTWRVTWPTLPLKFEDPNTIRSPSVWCVRLADRSVN